MKALVAGGAGFIGCHLCERLLKENNEVVCIDDFSKGSRANLENILGNEKFKLYYQDICNLEKVTKIFEQEKIDIVYHLAANSDIKLSAENPSIEYYNTFTTTYNILSAMRSTNTKRIFFASTSAIYGNKEDDIMSEDASDLRPISYYGGAKYASEAFISSFTHMNDFESLIFRFPNVVGPKLTHGVIFDFINKLKENPKELQILGNGLQSKPYMYVNDLIDGIIMFTKQLKKGLNIYNIGVDTSTSVNEIADIIIEKMKLKNVKKTYTGGNIGWKGDVSKFAFDLKKIKKAGFINKTTSTEAVVKTVDKLLK